MFALVSCFLPNLKAQEDADEQTDKVEALKIAFITEKLSLTSAEAKLFWPVFNEFNAQLKKLKHREKENIRAFKSKSDPTEQETEKFMSEYLLIKQAEIDLTRRYVAEFRKVLPARKVARLLTLEQEFKQALLQRLRDMRKKGGN